MIAMIDQQSFKVSIDDANSLVHPHSHFDLSMSRDRNRKKWVFTLFLH